MESIREVILQEMNEERFNRKHIDAKIRKEIESHPDMQAKLDEGEKLVNAYIEQDYYASKNARIEQLKNMDIRAIVLDLFIGVAYSLRSELFSSVTAQMSSRLKFSDRVQAITTVAELLAVLCQTDAFDIFKEKKQSSLMLVSRLALSDELIDFIEMSQFLPPMVCTPLELTHNFSSGYLTHNDSLILGSGNHHDGDLCLDVLNKLGTVALKLDKEFLCKVEEEPTFELDTQDKVDQWGRYKKQSYMMYSLLANQVDAIYLNHKVDKRGRIYAHGYHINTQGTSFKKAMLEFADEDIVQGVP